MLIASSPPSTFRALTAACYCGGAAEQLTATAHSLALKRRNRPTPNGHPAVSHQSAGTWQALGPPLLGWLFACTQPVVWEAPSAPFLPSRELLGLAASSFHSSGTTSPPPTGGTSHTNTRLGRHSSLAKPRFLAQLSSLSLFVQATSHPPFLKTVFNPFARNHLTGEPKPWLLSRKAASSSTSVSVNLTGSTPLTTHRTAIRVTSSTTAFHLLSPFCCTFQSSAICTCNCTLLLLRLLQYIPPVCCCPLATAA